MSFANRLIILSVPLAHYPLYIGFYLIDSGDLFITDANGEFLING